MRVNRFKNKINRNVLGKYTSLPPATYHMLFSVLYSIHGSICSAFDQDIQKKGENYNKGFITLDEFLAWYEEHCRHIPKDGKLKVCWY